MAGIFSVVFHYCFFFSSRKVLSYLPSGSQIVFYGDSRVRQIFKGLRNFLYNGSKPPPYSKAKIQHRDIVRIIRPVSSSKNQSSQGTHGNNIKLRFCWISGWKELHTVRRGMCWSTMCKANINANEINHFPADDTLLCRGKRCFI